MADGEQQAERWGYITGMAGVCPYTAEGKLGLYSSFF